MKHIASGINSLSEQTKDNKILSLGTYIRIKKGKTLYINGFALFAYL